MEVRGREVVDDVDISAVFNDAAGVMVDEDDISDVDDDTLVDESSTAAWMVAAVSLVLASTAIPDAKSGSVNRT